MAMKQILVMMAAVVLVGCGENREAKDKKLTKAEAYAELLAEAKKARDLVTAYAWYNISATNGNRIAEDGIPIITKSMTTNQIAEAVELIKEMVKKNPKLLNK
jgi:hypothetical protein